jgi:hypothetical protein
MEYIFALGGFIAGALFAAYRLRGDRTTIQAVRETLSLSGPSTKPPAR